jgi:hypothetical protein
LNKVIILSDFTNNIFSFFLEERNERVLQTLIFLKVSLRTIQETIYIYTISKYSSFLAEAFFSFFIFCIFGRNVATHIRYCFFKENKSKNSQSGVKWKKRGVKKAIFFSRVKVYGRFSQRIL